MNPHVQPFVYQGKVRPKKKSLDSGNQVPTLLFWALLFWGTSENFSSIFKVLLMISFQPTYMHVDPTKYWDVHGKKTFVFGLNEHLEFWLEWWGDFTVQNDKAILQFEMIRRFYSWEW